MTFQKLKDIYTYFKVFYENWKTVQSVRLSNSAHHYAGVCVFTLAITENLHLCFSVDAFRTRGLAKYSLFPDNLWGQWHWTTKNANLGYLFTVNSKLRKLKIIKWLVLAVSKRLKTLTYDCEFSMTYPDLCCNHYNYLLNKEFLCGHCARLS